MAKITGMQGYELLLELFDDASEETGDQMFSALAELQDDIDDVAQTERIYNSEYDEFYDRTALSNTSVKLEIDASRESDNGAQSSEGALKESLTFSGRNFASFDDSTEVTKLAFNGKETETYRYEEEGYEYETNDSEAFTGGATFRYKPFTDDPLRLLSLNDNGNAVYNETETYNGYSRTSTSKEDYKFSLGSDLSGRDLEVSGRLKKVSLTYKGDEATTEQRQDGEHKSTLKESFGFTMSSKQGIDISGQGAAGVIDSLKLNLVRKSTGDYYNSENSESVARDGSFSYDGKNIDASVLSSDSPADILGKLLAGDDQITGTTGSDRILGIGGKDSYAWDIRKDGADQVNLSRSISAELDGGGAVEAAAQARIAAAVAVVNEEIDTVAISGAKGKEQIRVSFVSAEVGNGDSHDDASGANEDGGLAVRIQLENGSDGLTGSIGRFDDEGMQFTAKAGTFDVRDLNSGAARGDQFKTVTLGTQAGDTLKGGSGADYFNGGAGNDSIDGGAGNDFVVGGAGNDTLLGGKGFDKFIGGAGNDTFVFAKGDSGFKVAKGATEPQADIVNDFVSGTDKLQFDGIKLGTASNYSEAQAGVADYNAALAAATEALKGQKTADKSALFNFQFTESNGYLFEDYTGDGKIDQVIVLVGINNTEIGAADLGFSVLT